MLIVNTQTGYRINDSTKVAFQYSEEITAINLPGSTLFLASPCFKTRSLLPRLKIFLLGVCFGGFYYRNIREKNQNQALWEIVIFFPKQNWSDTLSGFVEFTISSLAA